MSGFVNTDGQPTFLQWLFLPDNPNFCPPGVGSILISLVTLTDSVAYGSTSAGPLFAAQVEVDGKPANGNFSSSFGLYSTVVEIAGQDSGTGGVAHVLFDDFTGPIGQDLNEWQHEPTQVRSTVGTSTGLSHVSLFTFDPDNGAPIEFARWLPTGHPDLENDTPPPSGTPGSPKGLIPQFIPGYPTNNLPDTVLIDGDIFGPLNSWDSAADMAERAGVKLVDLGDGWETLPPIPTPGTPTLIASHGVNLISATHTSDIDNSEHAQRVCMEYQWPDPADGSRTVTRRAFGYGHGDYTKLIRRSGIPISQDVAQQTANALSDRAWLRGSSVTIVVTCCSWVRPGDTIRVTLPGQPMADWWAASVSHDSVAATSTIQLRAFALAPYDV